LQKRVFLPKTHDFETDDDTWQTFFCSGGKEIEGKVKFSWPDFE